MTAASLAQAADDAIGFGVESPVYAAIRAAQFVAMLAIIGALAFRFAVEPSVRRRGGVPVGLLAALRRRVDGVVFGGMLAMGIVTLARFVAQHAAMFGTDESWSRTTLDALLMQSGWGRGWWLGVVATVGGVLAARYAEGTLGRVLLALAAAALAVSLAMSGHPAAAASPVLAIAIDALHVAGAGAWVGSLGCLLFVAVPLALRESGDDRHRVVAQFVSAFSPVALGGAALAATTGGLAAWRNVGSVAALVTSPYGRWLLAKLAVLGVAAALGAYNWQRVRPTLGEPVATARLRRSAALELSAMLVLVIVTAVLVATPFPGEVGGTTTP